MEEHKHRHSYSKQLFEFRTTGKKKLILSLTITTIVMFIELAGGILTNSIALISDAGHMFTHSFAIAISLIAIVLAAKPPCHHRTFGLYRAEILAAFINGLFLLLVAGVIIYESLIRVVNPREVLSLQMLIVALIGLGVNVASIIILHGSHKESLNVKGVFYHMIADAASSVGIVIAAIVIAYTGWNILDPLVSIAISILIIRWAWGILKSSSRILLQMTPQGLDVDAIREDLKGAFPEIEEIHHIHLWTIIPNLYVFSAHLTPREKVTEHALLNGITAYLYEKYHVIESTIQIAPKGHEPVCNIP